MRQLVTAAFLTLAFAPTVSADWPSFRGPVGTGLSDASSAPLEWGKDKNIKWKVRLPSSGNSSPIVSNQRVFLPCAEDRAGTQRSLYCFDRRDGKKLWVKTVEYTKEDPTHNTNLYCGSTAAADGKRVVVWHGSAGLYCYDFEGNELWHHDLGEYTHMWGYGTSPVIYRDRVIMHCGPGKQISMKAFDLDSGKLLWSTDEPFEGDGEYNTEKKYMGSWSTPLITKVGDKDHVICMMPTRVVGYDPADGKIIWWCDGIRGPKGDLAYSSPVIVNNICVCTGGFGGPALGFKLGGTGDITGDRLWRTESNPQNIGSGIAYKNYVYRPNAGPGTIECLDPLTGNILWRDRAGGANYWGSIVLVQDRAYVTSQKGDTIVFRPNPEKFELLAVNELGEASNSTPAVSEGEIFIRTNQNLYCISGSK